MHAQQQKYTHRLQPLLLPRGCDCVFDDDACWVYIHPPTYHQRTYLPRTLFATPHVTRLTHLEYYYVGHRPSAWATTYEQPVCLFVCSLFCQSHYERTNIVLFCPSACTA